MEEPALAIVLLRRVRDRDDLELQLVVAASALLECFGNSFEVMERDGFVPDATVRMIIEGENPTTMAKSAGLALLELPTVFELLEPEVVRTQLRPAPRDSSATSPPG